jgi:hypothetical protein
MHALRKQLVGSTGATQYASSPTSVADLQPLCLSFPIPQALRSACLHFINFITVPTSKLLPLCLSFPIPQALRSACLQFHQFHHGSTSKYCLEVFFSLLRTILQVDILGQLADNRGNL